jgi:hypothetical protein
MVLAGLALVLGCGKEDLNKDLKPISPNAQPPGQGAFKPGGDGTKKESAIFNKK